MAHNTTEASSIAYPYLPEGREILYVDADNPYMQAAYEVAKNQSLDVAMPVGCVVVKEGVIIGKGANGSNYHENNVCERIKQNIPTGQGYELCEGCHPKNHGEPKAIADAVAQGHEVNGADMYLWGHWWCCQPCWEDMDKHGIRDVYLLRDSEKWFNKSHKDNVVGRQLEHFAS